MLAGGMLLLLLLLLLVLLTPKATNLHEVRYLPRLHFQPHALISVIDFCRCPQPPHTAPSFCLCLYFLELCPPVFLTLRIAWGKKQVLKARCKTLI